MGLFNFAVINRWTTLNQCTSLKSLTLCTRALYWYR